MKKALVVLLLLAFVGGGLFAQVTLTGLVNAGLGALKIGDNELKFGVLAKNAWVNGLRARVNVIANNDDSTVGFRGRIQASAIPGATFNEAIQFNGAYGYLKGMGGNFELRGGKIHESLLAANDGVLGYSYYTTNVGLQAQIQPIPLLGVYFGAHSAYGLLEGATWDAGGLTGWAGLRANLGVADARAIFKINSGDTTAAVSAAFNAGPAALGVGGYFEGLNAFADAGIMRFMLSAKLNVLEGLGLGLYGLYAMNNAPSADPFMSFGAEVDYTIAGVKPMLSLAYVSGKAATYASGLNYWANNFDTTPTWNANQSYLTINPAVWFAGNRFEVGALVNLDMGSASSNNGFGAYLNYNVAF